MRRPLLIIFIIILFMSFFISNMEINKHSEKNQFIKIEGLVKNKVRKEKYNQYYISDYVINDYSKKINIKPGDIVEVSGKIKYYKELKFEDFNYGRYLKSNGYEGTIDIKSYRILNKNVIYSNIFKFKERISKSIKYLYKDKSKFINSILIGEKENIDKETKEIFSKTGVSHILALSGLHVSILITIIGYSIGGINSFYKLILISIILCVYSIMVGQSPSIVRAIYYSLISYMGIFIFKRPDGISSLSFIGTILLINNPYIIYNMSFQLSFLATLSIIYFYGYINSKIKIKLIALTISANILTLPMIYLYFKNISLISIISNIVVVPFLSIIIYISILSAIILPISLTLSKIMVIINSLIIDFINQTLEMLYNLKFSYIEFDEVNKLFVITYYILVGIYMIYKEIKTIKEQENELQGYHQKHEQQRI
ncbi:competence membrane protein [[Clostridium] sordellii]|uniref:Membrane protein n=3 Tax=Paraclostridium sordellii TaxID=1505 RepID=A0ABP1XQK5_PARSO|nr:ComEC/Rec2 family competence protein [Paeniclostridium sordellii]CEJ72598.1 putative membrane protein [[Clostridium] sordellii] [Paeniclostridium sordellii]CEN68151.1 competence membrane protein [[Clostridium] sordellii] [Paeniclostridium sordellii]CEN71418.1 competence membrane protein [[Clostridium] sordellii] [Paeniclostridium sordellii]CEO21305.1 competence membrane protein [[Clostridium] sordellii] [Paeniclostridium sordellii]CEP76989.1 competence membrane protein [[Clostridium] sordel